MDLPQALEPLYRSYLRRLDEMAARVPRDALLCEATTRGDDGRLVLGDDGLPLRFDVADARSGETYEVRGARPDEPLAAEAQVSGLTVRLLAGNWEALPLSCSFDGPPVLEDAQAAAELVRSWAVLAAAGGFSALAPARGTEGADRWSGRLHSCRVEVAGEELRALFDLGSCPPRALESLFASLAIFGGERAPLSRAALGGAAPDAAGS